jgi:arylsulfatase A-like enzyme
LYLPWCIPHARYEIPSIEPYEDKLWPPEAKVHAAMITRMDGHVGMIMSLLKELGIDERTIVFFCSDNGAAQRWEGIFDSSGPLRGKKGDLYEGGIRTPMIVRWLNQIPAGVVSNKVWYFADFLPTVVELAGAEASSNIDGISILPTLLEEEQNLENRFLYWEHFGGGFQQAVRVGDWKGLRLTPKESLQLYDLSKDIGEENNLAEQHPDIVQKIEDYLKTARTESKNWPTREH